MDCKEIQPVHPKGDQAWVFIGRTDAKADPHLAMTGASHGFSQGAVPGWGNSVPTFIYFVLVICVFSPLS